MPSLGSRRPSVPGLARQNACDCGGEEESKRPAFGATQAALRATMNPSPREGFDGADNTASGVVSTSECSRTLRILRSIVHSATDTDSTGRLPRKIVMFLAWWRIGLSLLKAAASRDE